jgi:uncharacterized protein YycO
MQKHFFSAGVLALVFYISPAACADALRDGDIIFHTSRSSQSIAVQKATRSPYSHMGMIFFRRGQAYVYEAIGRVQYTPLQRWIARGNGAHYVVKRLREADRLLTPQALTKLRRAAGQFHGKPYDLTFEWSDERIYCSELVWKIYDRALGVRIGRTQQLRDFDLTDPAVTAKMQQRYGDRVPLQETVISPGEMFAADELVLVVQH